MSGSATDVAGDGVGDLVAGRYTRYQMATAAAPLEIVLDAALRRELQKLAAESQRSESEVAADALKTYFEHQAWMASEIEQAVREADAGDFASEEEVEATFKKWL